MTPNQTIANWLNDLAVLTAGHAPIADAKTKIAAYTRMLADEFPPEAFTRASHRHVADACRFFPAYADLRTLLAAWWRDNRPPPPTAIAGPSALRLSSQDKAAVNVWLRRRAAGTIDNIATSLHMLREHYDAQFAYLVATDEQCRDIATRRGWLPVGSHQAEWADLTEISLTRKLIEIEQIPGDGLRHACLNILRTAVTKHKPNLEHMLPATIHRRPNPEQPHHERPSSVLPEQLQALGIKPAPTPLSAHETFQAKYGRDPGQLTPAQITEARAQAAKARAALAGS